VKKRYIGTKDKKKNQEKKPRKKVKEEQVSTFSYFAVLARGLKSDHLLLSSLKDHHLALGMSL
jgi:hypothetical protein